MSQPPAELQVAQLSDTGRARSHNEDYVDHFIPHDPQQLATKGVLCLVADGMGGHQAGEVASRAAVELVIDQYYRDVAHDVGSSLVRAFRAANRMIYDQAEADPSKAGMGTTLVAAAILDSKVYVASVGDSRVYILGNGRIAQITEDHSWVQEQLRAGLLTPEQARQHPQRNVVTRALGSKPAVDVDLFEGQLGEGDRLLLCSDGLSGLLEDRELLAVVEERPPEEAVRAMVALANERGGTDNITVLLVGRQADGGPLAAAAAGAATVQMARRRSGVPLLALLGGLVALAALVAVGLLVVKPLLVGTPTPRSEALTLTATALGGSSIQSPLTTPTATVASPATATGLPAGTPTASPEPTVTLLPSRTPTPERSPRPVAAPTSSVPAATTPAVLPTYPKPVLLAPTEENAGALSGVVRFQWSYPQALTPSHAFKVLIWRDGEAMDQGAADPVQALSLSINLDVLLPQRGGAGRYNWSVVVVHLPDETWLSPPADVLQFTYSGPGLADRGETTAQPPVAQATETRDRPTFSVPTLDLPTIEPIMPSRTPRP